MPWSVSDAFLNPLPPAAANTCPTRVPGFGFLFADSFTYGHYIDAYDGEGANLHEVRAARLGPRTSLKNTPAQFSFPRLAFKRDVLSNNGPFGNRTRLLWESQPTPAASAVRTRECALRPQHHAPCGKATRKAAGPCATFLTI